METDRETRVSHAFFPFVGRMVRARVRMQDCQNAPGGTSNPGTRVGKRTRDELRAPLTCSFGIGREAYPYHLTSAEACTTVEPVIVSQFVDLDPFATVGRL